MTDSLKTLVVDDNRDYRRFIYEVASSINGTEVVAAAPNGRVALSKLRQMPVDVVFLDLEMPDMSGLETLKNIKKSFPDVGVIMTSDDHTSQADQIIQTLQIGAIDFLPKPLLQDKEKAYRGFRLQLVTLLGLVRGRKSTRTVKRLQKKPAPSPDTDKTIISPSIEKEKSKPIGTLVVQPETGISFGPSPVQHDAAKTVPGSRNTSPVCIPFKFNVVAIGVSTGGPNALADLVPGLPNSLGVPILIVQHMPEMLTTSMAISLNKKSNHSVREGVDGIELEPNVIYLAPGGKHMTVNREKKPGSNQVKRYIGINNDPPVNSCRPAVDVLYRSLADAYDSGILAVIMTGMGMDGVKGIQMMKNKGCYCLTQTEETCVVYGMPRSVVDAKLSDEEVPLDMMAERITALVSTRGGTG